MPAEKEGPVSSRAAAGSAAREPWAVVCLADRRWDCVFARPQHLMSGFASERRVLFVEPPIVAPDGPRLDLRRSSCGLTVAAPRLAPRSLDERDAILERLLAEHLERQRLVPFLLWYYEPEALAWTRRLAPRAVVYDRLTAKASVSARALEARADVLFARAPRQPGGRGPRLTVLSDGIDAGRYLAARGESWEPAEQRAIPRPRVGFAGAIDDQLDLDLLAATAASRPDLQFLLLGPVRIDPARLPRRGNLHVFGRRPDAHLVPYLSGWDVAWLPLRRDGSPHPEAELHARERIAAGRPVVATPVREVCGALRELGLIEVADGALETGAAIDRLLARSPAAAAAWLERVDAHLAATSWSAVRLQMTAAIERALRLPVEAPARELVAVR
jgi:UDP-galactopyranose mutase